MSTVNRDLWYGSAEGSQHRWKSVALVTTPDQDTRARVRFERCFPGAVYVVTTPLAASGGAITPTVLG